MKPTLITLIFLAAMAFVAFSVIGRKDRSAVHSQNIPARTAHLSRDAISVVKSASATKSYFGGTPHWSLLFQMDTDDDLKIMWGDAGMIYFWVRRDDARKLKFDNTWVILQCG
ncbi:MAG: DUF1963 domain-containing protein [Verrucomicrobia bacterium]|nr:DUF1963 domain-containing protein [Verrucomicrobiota bacterium]